jgi:hypothetical protein
VHLLHRKRNNKNFKKNAFQLQSLPEDWKQQVSYYQELEDTTKNCYTGNMKYETSTWSSCRDFSIR